MVEFESLRYNKKCRIWLDELPSINYNVISIKSMEFVADIYDCDNQNIALELKLPRNSSNYALLGGKYISDKSGSLKIEVQISNYEDSVYNDSIVPNLDKVFCGIPKEYGDAIFKYIINNLSDLQLPSGKMVFNIGAHGIVGSSEFMFSLMTQIILKLFVSNLKYDNLEQIKTIVFENN